MIQIREIIFNFFGSATSLLLSFSLQAMAEGIECSNGGFVSGKITQREIQGTRNENDDLPRKSAAIELAVQPVCKFETTKFAADGSAFVRQNPSEVTVGGILHELYVRKLFNQEKMSAIIGKRRIVWGPGLFHNPTDLINPPKEPAAPLQQRTGAWLIGLEYTCLNSTWTILAAPGTAENKTGLPKQFINYPLKDTPAEPHFLLAGRYSFIFAETEMNLMLFNATNYSNKARCCFQFGISASKVVGAQSYYFESLINNRALESTSQKKLYQRTLIGTQHFFEDGATLVLEFLHQQDGLSASELDKANAMSLSDLPLKNYLAAHYGDYVWNENFGVSGDLLASLQFLAGYIGPSAFWKFGDGSRLSLQYLELLASASRARSNLQESEAPLVRRIATAEIKFSF